MRISYDDVVRFANRTLKTAIGAAEEIALIENRREAYAKSAQSITDFPRIAVLPLGFGAIEWAAILFVDMRDSTSRCELYGPRLTYLTMHTYLSTMGYIVERYGGVVMGLRGDGLFAAFGLGEDGTNPSDLDEKQCVKDATLCGRAMIEAVDYVIGPLLEDQVISGAEKAFKKPLVGCGVDADRIVLTRIGYLSANEVTAYGTAVNKAAKLASTSGDVVIGLATRKLYPKSKGGKLTFRKRSDVEGFTVGFPEERYQLK